MSDAVPAFEDWAVARARKIAEQQKDAYLYSTTGIWTLAAALREMWTYAMGQAALSIRQYAGADDWNDWGAELAGLIREAPYSQLKAPAQGIAAGTAETSAAQAPCEAQEPGPKDAP